MPRIHECISRVAWQMWKMWKACLVGWQACLVGWQAWLAGKSVGFIIVSMRALLALFVQFFQLLKNPCLLQYSLNAVG